MLDTRTLIFCGGVGQLLAALLLIGVAVIHRRELAARYWACAYLMLALGTPLFIMRGMVSDFMSIVVANTLSIGGVYLIYVGVAQFERRPKYWRAGLSMLLASALGLAYWAYVDPRLPARVIMANLGIIPFALMISWTMLRTRMIGQRIIPLAISALFLAVAIGNTIRVVDAAFRWDSANTNAFAAPWLALWLALTLAVVFLSATGFLIMIQLRVQARLDRLANHDPLTGLFNRRAFRRRVIDVMRQAVPDRADGAGGVLLLMDLDRFKQLNDHFGHLAGDRVLRAFANVLMEKLPPEAIAGRFGGDEFCVLLPEANAAQAAQQAEIIRAATERLAVIVGPAIVRVQVSIGLSEPTTSLSFNELLRRADQALYQAKSAGRNSVALGDKALALMQPASLAH
ncbi:GGDEF domain-containing protein [Pigmentiphaga aceris]|nr:GGDEF domain-containing protein [Pigmentiphaga aceris]